MPFVKAGRPCRDCKSIVCYCHDEDERTPPMTNDTNVPEWIWLLPEDVEEFKDTHHAEGAVCFVPHDHALALAAAAVAHPQDAQAALEADRNRVREETLREAIAACEPGELTHYGPEPYRICQAKIRALIEGDTDE